MIAKPTGLRLFLDEGVPVAVGAALARNRHIVIYHREALVPGVPDEVVCAAALQNKAILVAVDGDMKRMMRSYGSALKTDRFKYLNFIGLCCNEVQAAGRLEQALPLVQLEWQHAAEKPARRLWIEIGPNYIRTNR